MATRGRPSVKDREMEDEKALGPDRVPENQKREVYERVRRAVEAKSGGYTSHKVGSSAWDKHEQKVLEDGLRYYPHERHSNMLIYIRIAASLPKKTVRDVAHHLRHMQDAHRAKVDAAAGMHPAKRHQPDPAAAAAMAAMHDHHMAAMYAANAAGMAPMHTLPGLAQGLSGPGGPGPHLKDEKVEARVCTLLQQNMTMISSIRENMAFGRFFDNHSLMIAFDKNVKEVTALLATLPFADMQKLPVQINPYFISGSLPPGVGPPQPGSPTQHHPPAPTAIPFSGGVNLGSGNGSIGPVASGVDISNVNPAAAPPGGGVQPPQVPLAQPPITTAVQQAVQQAVQPQAVSEAANAPPAAAVGVAKAGATVDGATATMETAAKATTSAPTTTLPDDVAANSAAARFAAVEGAAVGTVRAQTDLAAPVAELPGEVAGGERDKKDAPAEAPQVAPPGV